MLAVSRPRIRLCALDPAFFCKIGAMAEAARTGDSLADRFAVSPRSNPRLAVGE
jgi:hypothetical protein